MVLLVLCEENAHVPVVPECSIREFQIRMVVRRAKQQNLAAGKCAYDGIVGLRRFGIARPDHLLSREIGAVVYPTVAPKVARSIMDDDELLSRLCLEPLVYSSI